MAADIEAQLQLDQDSFAQGYFKNAVYRHWDPSQVEGLETDRERLIATAPEEEDFEGIRASVARFGAGEESVTEDLMPLALVTEDINDQMFLTSQLYEEAKHTQFFDRYWREVINPVAEELGYEITSPTDERYYNEDYNELFDRTEEAMERLLTEDTPENRVKAYCHYHLTIESILAQTGYYGFQSAFSETGSDDIVNQDLDDMAEEADIDADDDTQLPGLVNGIAKIRSDEGRHVGFGMQKVRGHVQDGTVDQEVVEQTLNELVALVAGSVADLGDTINSGPLVAYARDKFNRRLEIIANADAELPPVEELVEIEGAEAAD
jgi:ribonucleoside-diphosphate reductase beta chain